MLIVYDDKGEILYVSINTSKPATCENVCKFHVKDHVCEECDHCITVDDDHDIAMNYKQYRIVNSRLVKESVIEIKLEPDAKLMDSNLSTKRYQHPKGETLDIKISIVDSNRKLLLSTGKFLFIPSRGSLSIVEKNITNESQISVSWKLPLENTEEKFKCYFYTEDDVLYSKFKVLLIN